MSWTDERVEVLKRMWAEGASAMQIADELGGVSRNAVIGKAHRLGLQPTSDLTSAMLLRAEDLEFSVRTAHILRSQNIIFLGDLAQMTEAELLRLPNFGRKSLLEVREFLGNVGLRTGMVIRGWPPENIVSLQARFEAARRASQLEQAKGGATFEPLEDRFSMVHAGDDTDLAAALRPTIEQMKEALLEKARNFESVAKRLENQIGWSGIGRTTKKLVELLDRSSAALPDVLGLIYPVALELGSFIELDEQLATGGISYAEALDPEVRRPLSDLVRTLAPWLRSFPTIREADDEASQFLVKVTELKPASEVIEAASKHSILSEEDIEVFHELFGAADRGTFLGEKAGGRAKQSAANLVIGAAGLAGSFFLGASASSYADSSPLAQRVGEFLVQTETSITELVKYLPTDVRIAISELIEEVPGQPPIMPQPAVVVSERAQRLKRVDDDD